MRPGVGRQRRVGDVVPTQSLDAPGAGHTFGISDDDEFQQQLRIIGRTAVAIVLTVDFKGRKIGYAADQPGDGIIETAGEDLLVKDYRNHLHLIVDLVLIARHDRFHTGLIYDALLSNRRYSIASTLSSRGNQRCKARRDRCGSGHSVCSYWSSALFCLI